MSARSTSERRTRQVRPDADGREAAALDPRADRRRMELQLLADLRHGQPRVLFGTGPVGNWSGIHLLDESLRGLYQLDVFEHS